MIIKVLKADCGDSILIKYKGNDNNIHNILIDGGLEYSYHSTIKDEIRTIEKRNESIDLLIITHTDSDHIGGIKAFIEDKEISKKIVNQFWFNATENVILDMSDSTNISTKQGIKLQNYLKTQKKWHKQAILALQTYHLFGVKLTILSPNKKGLEKFQKKLKSTTIGSPKSDHKKTLDELMKTDKFRQDTSVYNDSSIAFILEFNHKKTLFLSDTKPSTIVQSLKQLGYTNLKKLQVNYVKIAHHGSKANTNYQLLELIDCYNFIVSTDASAYNHPHKVTFARIIKQIRKNSKKKINFIFNYESSYYNSLFTNAEKKKYNFTCSFAPESESGFIIKL